MHLRLSTVRYGSRTIRRRRAALRSLAHGWLDALCSPETLDPKANAYVHLTEGVEAGPSGKPNSD